MPAKPEKSTRPRTKDVPQPKTPPDERATLLGFLNYLRDRVIAKIEGVPEPEIRTPGVESGTNLLGLIKHLSYVERHQFLQEKPTSWPNTFRATDQETVAALLADYREAIRLANEVITAAPDLDTPVNGNSQDPHCGGTSCTR